MNVPHAALMERNQRLAAARKVKVLAAAMEEARAIGGFQFITRSGVASRAGVADASVSFAFGGMIELKRAVLHEAVRAEDLVIIGQGLSEQHPIVMAAPQALRERAARAMVAG